ncbi:MAG: hypothetical protein AB1716_18510 [Planctomycetota bacterium]
MPRAFEFADRHKADQDRFAILAFNGPTETKLTEVDPGLKAIQERYWKGRALPFPLLLDGTGRTVAAWGVTAYPTSVLIDPDGNVVEFSHAAGYIESSFERLLTEMRAPSTAPTTQVTSVSAPVPAAVVPER